MELKIKRVYDAPEKEDGFRILVDRLWPRGVSKEKGKIDLWLKEIAPSTELRKWFNHDSEKWELFIKRYLNELEQNKEVVNVLKDKLKKGSVTLIYAAKDTIRNEAEVLKNEINNL